MEGRRSLMIRVAFVSGIHGSCQRHRVNCEHTRNSRDSSHDALTGFLAPLPEQAHQPLSRGKPNKKQRKCLHRCIAQRAPTT